MASYYTRGPSDEFAATLTDLKTTGSNLLVTGGVTAGVRAACSRTMFSAAEDRKRILALADSHAASPHDHLPATARLDSPATTLIDARNSARSASVQTASTDSTLDADHDFRTIRRKVTRTVETYDAETDGLDAAQLRLGVDSIDALPWALDDERLLHALRVIRSRIVDVSGLAHYHVALPDSSPEVQALWESGLFDARVELRKRKNLPPEHRWHMPGFPTTKWVGLS